MSDTPTEWERLVLLGLDGFAERFPTSQGWGFLIGPSADAARSLAERGLLETKEGVSAWTGSMRPKTKRPLYRITAAGTALLRQSGTTASWEKIDVQAR